MKLQVVKEANVRVVKRNQLKINDKILWSNLEFTVKEINETKKEVMFDTPLGVVRLRFYRYYFVILDCIKEEGEI